MAKPSPPPAGEVVPDDLRLQNNGPFADALAQHERVVGARLLMSPRDFDRSYQQSGRAPLNVEQRNTDADQAIPPGHGSLDVGQFQRDYLDDGRHSRETPGNTGPQPTATWPKPSAANKAAAVASYLDQLIGALDADLAQLRGR